MRKKHDNRMHTTAQDCLIIPEGGEKQAFTITKMTEPLTYTVANSEMIKINLLARCLTDKSEKNEQQ